MSLSNKTRHIRVFFSYAASHPLAPLSSLLKATPEIELCEYIGNADSAWSKAIAHSADVTVLFFPEILEEHLRCIRRILRGSFTEIILITDLAAHVADDDGRVEICRVPKTSVALNEVLSSILAAGRSRRGAAGQGGENTGAAPARGSAAPDLRLSGKIIAVGASTGGTEALSALLGELRPGIPGIVVVQHMPPVFTAMFAERLNRELPFDVREAEDNIHITPNSIHIAPGDRHLRIKKIGGGYYTSVGGTEKVSGHCPSVDALFNSAAREAGNCGYGVILTGMGSDGAEGLLEMKKRGAFTIGQDEASCIVYGMPRKAYELGAVSVQAPLKDIAGILMNQVR